MFFKLICIIVLLGLAGCSQKAQVEAYKKPHPLGRVEVITHPDTNDGMPVVLNWCFVRSAKANEAIQRLTAHQFWVSRADLQRSFPQDILFVKTTTMPDTNDIVEMPREHHIEALYLLVNFANKGVKRWVVLPRKRIRVEVARHSLTITTRPIPKKKKSLK